jgi:hypothetical protein
VAGANALPFHDFVLLGKRSQRLIFEGEGNNSPIRNVSGSRSTKRADFNPLDALEGT